MSYLFSNIKRLCVLVLVIGTAFICSHASATSDCDNYVKLFVDSTGKVTEATLVNDIDRMIEQQVTEICESLTGIDPRFRNEWILVPFSYEDLSEDGYTTITRDMIDFSKAEIIYKSCYIGNIPKFPGGDVALMKFVTENFNYPHLNENDTVQGKLKLRFHVSKNGEVDDVEVIDPQNTELEKEAIRVIKLLPKFTPGINVDGSPADYWFTLPLEIKP